eukprot:CAMPEP_0170407904 /NCGR_PEP_ID=MMETSP0117_2-20130122/28501_1 /TAXON_ID=400756 /ORGANISM="Durinskia baltica, Strain CSIRO CS-38" /LENGTH=66 /DNA_ID=CAMNT_0010665193 /DNA_START=33 /DNA_END=233 /DNA_ORIENTATION=-
MGGSPPVAALAACTESCSGSLAGQGRVHNIMIVYLVQAALPHELHAVYELAAKDLQALVYPGLTEG